MSITLESPRACLFEKYGLHVFHNVQYQRRSFAEITCCKTDFLRHKFSITQSISTLEQLATIVELKTKIKNLKNVHVFYVDE